MKLLSRAFAVLLIIAATFLVYWPALRNGFVWDDTALVLRDPLIRSWTLIREGFHHFLFLDATASNFYRPMQRLTFVADYQFFGFGWPGGWHLTSILIHAGAAVALFFVAEKILTLATRERLTTPVRRAWALVVAVLWAIHPLHTSAVTYVAGRADPLAALFGFTGLTLGLISLEAERRQWLWRIGAAAGFALALLSKESGVGFLLIWILILLWQRAPRQALAVWAALLAIVLGGYGTLRFNAHKTPPPSASVTPVAVRPVLAARAFAEYASLVVAPVTLRMERDVTTKPQADYDATMRNAQLREYQTLAGVLLLLGFAAWAIYCGRRVSMAALCLAAFVLAYIPISNIFSLNATVAEHWLYVPSAFLFLAIALTLISLGNREAAAPSKPLRYLLGGVALVWMILLGVRTFLRQEDWRDQRTFIERTIAAGGDSGRMQMNLANQESLAGKHEQAIALYRRALQRDPDQPMVWFGFAGILTRAHDLAGAREAIAHAQTLPLLKVDCQVLSATLDAAEKGINPLPLFQSLVQADPDNWNLRRRYLETLNEQGHTPEAARDLTRFLTVHPFRADSWKLLARFLEKMDRPQAAGAAYQEAAHRDVHDAESKANAERLTSMR